MTPEKGRPRPAGERDEAVGVPPVSDSEIVGPQSTSVDPLLATEAEVAEVLRLGRSTVRRLRARGAIPGAVRVGRSRRYSLAIVRAWAEVGCPPASRWPREWKEGGRS